MYLYQVDRAVTYTSEDLVLFRDSPFAAWMERLTLENPDHGIPPDSGTEPPQNSMTRQDDIAATLREEGKDVLLVDWDAAEPQRRTATLEAMRAGVDFIVNGQLALGPLSGSANLLMRTSGYSELGDYLYIPCDTQAKTTLHSAFRLCFLADLLHSLQGQLPPQMLIIRGGDLVPLQTEDHIYHYQAVKHRFMDAMREFRKHRMPDPSESGQFGRWSECAAEVMRQRALKKDRDWQQAEEPQQDHIEAAPLPQFAAVGDTAAPTPAPDTTRRTLVPGAAPGASVASPGGQVPTGPTLVEQARMLAPSRVSEPRADAGGRGFCSTPDQVADHGAISAPGISLDTALDNLEFIGSSRYHPPAERPIPSPKGPEERPPTKAEPEAAHKRDSWLVDSDEVGFLPLDIDEEALTSDSISSPTDHESRSDQYAAASGETSECDSDEPGPFGSLPLPEVEEIGLDGTVLSDEWPEQVQRPVFHTEDKFAPVDESIISKAPPPALGPNSGREDSAADVGSVVVLPASHPLDSVLPNDDLDLCIDFDSEELSISAPMPEASEESLSTGTIDIDEQSMATMEPARPRQAGDDEPPPAPFSDSLITSDDYEN